MIVKFYREYNRVEVVRAIHDLEISDQEHALIQSGKHPDYDDIADWARDQDLPDDYETESLYVDFQDSDEDGVLESEAAE